MRETDKINKNFRIAKTYNKSGWPSSFSHLILLIL